MVDFRKILGGASSVQTEDFVVSDPLGTGFSEIISAAEQGSLEREKYNTFRSSLISEDFTGLDDAVAQQNIPDYSEDLYGADTATGAASGASAGQAVGAGNTGVETRPNPLDSFANYTYGISLHVIPKDVYNSLANGGGYSPGDNVLIASGGRQDQNGFGRNPNFKEDFYFDNVKINTVIGYNARNRGSNAVDLSFTVLEPYGISLLDRLLNVASDLGAENWNQMPFMLQIDFFGNSDDGQPIRLESQTKYIPIKLIACNIRASSKGSEYRFSAVPYNHLAFHETLGTTPTNLEIIAETVEDFFKNDQDGSYSTALKKYQTKLKEEKRQEYQDEYKFEIDEDIAKSKIIQPKQNNIRSTTLATVNNKDANMQKGLDAKKSGGSVPVDLKKQSISINAGSSIVDVINLVIRNSEYISKQVDPEKSYEVAGDQPINFYKIIPKIEIGEYDDNRKEYQRTITYQVKKFSYYNSRFPSAFRSIPSSWEKEYHYLYTGKNQSILNFNIEFDTMFYTAMTALATNKKAGEIDAEKPEKDKGAGGEAAKSSGIAQNRIRFVSRQAQSGTDTVGSNNIKNVSANDLYQSIMTNSRGDMITVKLTISGDPELIKQDDYYSDLGTSIPMDAKDIFAYISFRSPSDIDQDSGLYDFTSWPQTTFSGVYKILIVENVFERGQFIQNLDCVRMHEQTTDSQSPSAGSSAGSRSNPEVSDNGGYSEAERQINFAKIIPGTDSTGIYAEDGTVSGLRVNTETGDRYVPIVESTGNEDYFNKVKQIQGKINRAPEQSIADDSIWSRAFGPSGA